MANTYTKTERAWIMYDVGNSALVLLNSTVAPIYFSSLCANSNQLIVAWGAAQTIASLVVAMLMPILGAFADYAGCKKKFFSGVVLTGILLCCAQIIPLSALLFLCVYVATTICLNASMTFYDAMLPDVTDEKNIDRVSSMGYAWGYIGSIAPFLVCIVLIFGGSHFGLAQDVAVRISFGITALWWLAFTIPLLKTYKQKFYKEPCEHQIRTTFKGLWQTMKRIAHDKRLFIFMLAYFFYIDGIHTIISMATSYGASLNIDSMHLVLALIVMQMVAFPASIITGKLADKFGTLRMIIIGVMAYVVCIFYAAFFLHTAVDFFVLSISIGLFIGGTQALSRSYFGCIIPKERANEYYGFFDVFGRYASVMGTALVSFITAVTNQASLGVLSIALLLLVGGVLLIYLEHKIDAQAYETTRE